jgi:hypothetical protein
MTTGLVAAWIKDAANQQMKSRLFNMAGSITCWSAS